MSDSITTRLLVGEREGLIFASSITTISFFSGVCSAENLKARLYSIVQANPWLLSKLSRSSESGEVIAKFPATVSSSDCNICFESITNTKVSKDMPYVNLMKELSSTVLPIGFICINTDIPLFKVTLIEIKPEKEIAIVMSLNHTIADGNTFYRIYSMLDSQTSVKALDYKRKFSFEDELVEATGGLQGWISSPNFGKGVHNVLESGLVPTVCAYSINQEEIKRMKEDYRLRAASSDDFISTNDIVTSWFLKLTQNDFGLIAVNFRNRFSGLTDNSVGNYHTILACDRSIYNSPENVRKAIKEYNRNGILPTDEETFSFNMGNVTNWSSFYKHIQLDDADSSQLMSQIPLFNSAGQSFKDVCVIFNVNPSTLCVLLMTRSPVNIINLVDTKCPMVDILKERII